MVLDTTVSPACYAPSYAFYYFNPDFIFYQELSITILYTIYCRMEIIRTSAGKFWEYTSLLLFLKDSDNGV
jgi:hypothetical protein